MKIRAYGKHIVALRLAKVRKGVGLFIPEAYEKEDIVEARVMSCGDDVADDLFEKDVITFKKGAEKAIISTNYDFDTFIVHIDDVLTAYTESWRRAR